MGERQNKKVLIVDDDPKLLEELQIAVTNWGYMVVPASGPEEAIQMFNADPEIHLIISDFGMAPWNGIAVIRFLKATINRKFEAIIFTGARPGVLEEVAIDAGVRKVVYKPDYELLQEEFAAAVTALGMSQ